MTENITEKKLHKPFAVIMKRELKSYFTSPVAYIVMVIFLVIAGFLFFPFFFLQGVASLREYFSLLPLYISCFVPALTMRVYAEEKRVGSFETLMTLPVTEYDVVLGKYLASFLTTLIMIAPTLLYMITVAIFGNPDFGPMIAGFIGAIFLSAAYTSIGCFASAITKNQIIAFFVGLIICLVFTFIDSMMMIMPSQIVAFISYFSSRTHFNSIAKGIIDTRDIVYFLSITALFYVLTVKVIKKARD